ncbi:PKD domain-containing protein [Glutamicibacter uratoxydans]|uniref:PKD domain-containing protein n=1 Tax=Glutamicibacter uratoxydans TaxID=43667 RepID=UPI003D6EE9FC
MTNNAPQRDGQEYTIEYIDQCTTGFEFANGCDVNTDEARCTDGSSPYIRIVRFRGGDRDGQVYSLNRICPGDDTPIESDPEGIIVEEIRISPAEFRRFPILPSILNSDPEQFSLRNGHTHLWAAAETQTFSTNINGTPVEVRAIPIQWLWDYGDGSTRVLNYPGEPAPNHTLHHETPTSYSYTETGVFEVNLTTLYRGEFRIVGEGWQSIPGQAAVPSNAVPIDVWRTEKELVAPDGQ